MAPKGICEICGFADDSYRIEENGTVMKVCKLCHDGYLERMGLPPDADAPIKDVASMLDIDIIEKAGIDTDGMTGEELLQLKLELEERNKKSKVPTLDASQLDTLLGTSEDDKKVLSGVRQKEARRRKRAVQMGLDESGEDYTASEELLRSGEELQRVVMGLEADDDDLEDVGSPLIAKIVAEKATPKQEQPIEQPPEEPSAQETPTEQTGQPPEEPPAQETPTEEVAEQPVEETPEEQPEEIPKEQPEEPAEQPPEEVTTEQPTEEPPQEEETPTQEVAEQPSEQPPTEQAHEEQPPEETPTEEPPEETPAEQTEEKDDRPREQEKETTQIAASAEVEESKETEMKQPVGKKEKKAAVTRAKIHAEANQKIDDERIRITSPEIALENDTRPKTNLDVAVSQFEGGVRFLNAFKYVMHRVSYAVFLGVVVLAVATVMFIREGWQHALIVLGGGAGAVMLGFLLMWYLSHCYETDRRALLLRIRQQEILFDSMNSECYRELRTKFTMIKALGWLLDKLSVLLPLLVFVGGNVAAIILAFLNVFWLLPVISAGSTIAGVLVYYVVKFAADMIAYKLDIERNQQIQQQTLLDLLDKMKKDD